jgi:hypothetical protein
LLSERLGEGSWTLPLEIGWIPPKSNPITYGVAQVEEFVKRQSWSPERILVVDAHYTGEPSGSCGPCGRWPKRNVKGFLAGGAEAN